MNNQKGFAEVAILYGALVVLGLLFINNPVSNFLGIGVRPNKTVQIQTQKVEPVKDAQGNVVAYKTTTNVSDQDIQQHVTFWEWLKSLPIVAVILMGLGVAFPVVGLFLHNLWSKAVTAYNELFKGSKDIVDSVKKALDTITDPTVKANFMTTLSAQQDQSTKDLVKELLKVGT